VKIGNIVFDCSDPDRVAAFWAAALGYEKGEYPPEMRKELVEAGLTEAELAGRSIAEDPEGHALVLPKSSRGQVGQEPRTSRHKRNPWTSGNKTGGGH
jgi:hypothetical protein